MVGPPSTSACQRLRDALGPPHPAWNQPHAPRPLTLLLSSAHTARLLPPVQLKPALARALTPSCPSRGGGAGCEARTYARRTTGSPARGLGPGPRTPAPCGEGRTHGLRRPRTRGPGQGPWGGRGRTAWREGELLSPLPRVMVTRGHSACQDSRIHTRPICSLSEMRTGL